MKHKNKYKICRKTQRAACKGSIAAVWPPLLHVCVDRLVFRSHQFDAVELPGADDAKPDRVRRLPHPLRLSQQCRGVLRPGHGRRWMAGQLIV